MKLSWFLISITLFLGLVILPHVSQAEYRAYRLGVKYHPEDKTQPEIEVLSNLDDQQYESYYKITPNQQTRIIHHWMCVGRTDYEAAYCTEPPMAKSTTPNSPAPSPSSSQDQGLNVRAPAQVPTR